MPATSAPPSSAAIAGRSAWRGSRKRSIRNLPASGPKASSPAASSSQAIACRTWWRSGAPARSSSAAASPTMRRRAAGADGSVPLLTDSAGIEARLQLLVLPLARVPAVTGRELRVRALFQHVPVAQHHDVVRIGDGAQAVAHDHDAAPDTRLPQVRKDARLGVGVH